MRRYKGSELEMRDTGCLSVFRDCIGLCLSTELFSRWYRILSPRAVVEVKEIVYNRRKNVLFLEVVQRFRVRWSPFPPIPARSIVRLDLEERDGLHYIVLEEDLFHPVDVAALVIPPLKPFVSLALRASNFVHYIGAGIAQNVGVWKPEPVRTTVTA